MHLVPLGDRVPEQGSQGMLAALAGLDCLIAIVDDHGGVRHGSHGNRARNILDLVRDDDRPKVRALLSTCSGSGSPVRALVTDGRGRPCWLELAPGHAPGVLLAVWMPSEPLEPVASSSNQQWPMTPTSAPVRPPMGSTAQSPGEAPPKSTPMPVPRFTPMGVPARKALMGSGAKVPDYAVVADAELRDVAARLRRALDRIADNVAIWFVPEFQRYLSRAGPDTKLIVIGTSRHAQFLRKLTGEPKYSVDGVNWAVKGRRAAIWYNSLAWTDPMAVIRRHEKGLQSLQEAVAQAAVRREFRDDPREMCRVYLEEMTATGSARRRHDWPQVLPYLVGVGRFLLDGGFSELADLESTDHLWRD